jgi:hypothetical protein
VTFTPTAVGLQSNQLTLSDTAGSQVIALTGTGVLTGGSLTLTPTKLTFSEQTVGTTSAQQSALLVNNGNSAVTITNIIGGGNFAETNTCGSDFPTVPVTLNVGQSCTIYVSFTPTGAGAVTGSVTITSNATTSSLSLSLSGTGVSQFTLSANSRSTVATIGTKSVNFTISASAPSSFQSGIALSCSGSASCSFSPSSVLGGGSSTLTVTGLSSTSANPLNLTVTGTSGQQTATVALSIFFADFSVASTPTGTTVVAGKNATYTITITPTSGFSQAVLLSCGSIPQDTACYWNPPAVSFAGTSTAQNSTLTITTTAQSKVPPVLPPRSVPPAMGRWLLSLALLLLLVTIVSRWGRWGAWARPQARLAALVLAIGLMAMAVGCENYVNPININPVVNGTPSGTTSILLTGTLSLSNTDGTVTTVTRSAVVTLSVLPSS